MKKVFFTIALSFLFISGIQAQDDFKFGVTGGLVNSSLNSKVGIGPFSLDTGKLASGTGFYLGAAASLDFGEKFGLQPELVYVKAGDLEFIQLPIMVKYYVIPDLYAQAGPQISVSTSAGELNDIISLIPGAEDFVGVKTLGIDLGFGAGYEILDNLSLQARYSLELTSRTDGVLDFIGQARVYNFNLGVIFYF